MKWVWIVLSALAPLFYSCGAPCPAVLHTVPAEALAEFDAPRAGLRTLRAEATVEQFASHGRVRGTVLMFVSLPEQVRFDVMTDFGPAAILTSDGHRFALADLRETRFMQGPTCASNIGRLLGIPMSGADVGRLLLGDAPRLAGQDAISCSDGQYRVVTHVEGVRRQELFFEVHEDDLERPPESQRLRLREAKRFDVAGTLSWRVEYSDFRELSNNAGGSVSLPFRIRFQDPVRDADTTVRFKEMNLGVDVPQGAFVQTPAPGMLLEEVACESVEGGQS